MQIIVNRTKATRRVTEKLIELRIGANEFTDADAAEIIADPYFDACRRRGIFHVQNAPAVADEIVHEPGDFVPNLRLLKIGEALKAVKDCTDIKLLDQWLHQDGRKMVKEAILKRGVAITDAKKAPAEAEPDEDDASDLGIPLVGG